MTCPRCGSLALATALQKRRALADRGCCRAHHLLYRNFACGATIRLRAPQGLPRHRLRHSL